MTTMVGLDYKHILGLLQMGSPVAVSYSANSTRFDIVLTPHIGMYNMSGDFMGRGTEATMVIVSLVNFRTSYQFALLDPEGFVNASYVAEKLRLGATDSVEIAKFLNRVTEAESR